MAFCKYCKEQIRWITNSDTGRKMPVNALESAFVIDFLGNDEAVINGEIYRGRIVGDAYEDERYELGHALHRCNRNYGGTK